MDLVNNQIISSDAGVFFGNRTALDNTTLESTLRYVALNRFQGDINEVKPVKFMRKDFYSGDSADSFVNSITENNIELLIAVARRDVQDFPVISNDGWESLDAPPHPVAAFLSKASDTKVFINRELKAAAIFVRTPTPRWIDMLCSIMCHVLLWRFPGKLTDEEIKFFQSINKKDVGTFDAIINNLCSKYNFRDAATKRALIGWNDEYRKTQIAKYKKTIEDSRSYIADYERRIAEYLNTIGATRANLETLEASDNSKDDTVYKFFMNHPNLCISRTEKETNGNIMYFSILETMDCYDVDEFERVYRTPNSYINKRDASIKKIMHAIFSENRGVFRVESMFKLTNLWSLTPCKNQRNSSFAMTHAAHPHLFYHGCLGGNSQHITTYLERGDWDMAIEQAIAATKNLNFGDETVVGGLMNRIANKLAGTNDHCKCIIADNGTEMTVREFYDYITPKETEES